MIAFSPPHIAVPLHQGTRASQTALIIAADGGELGYVEALLQLGAEPERRDEGGLTARDFAEQNGHETAKALLGEAARLRALCRVRQRLAIARGLRWYDADVLATVCRLLRLPHYLVAMAAAERALVTVPGLEPEPEPEEVSLDEEMRIHAREEMRHTCMRWQRQRRRRRRGDVRAGDSGRSGGLARGG